MAIPPPRQHVGILHDGEVRRCVLTDLEHAPEEEGDIIILIIYPNLSHIPNHQHAPPLGEVAACRLVLLAPLVEVVQTLRGALAVLGAEELLHALVRL